MPPLLGQGLVSRPRLVATLERCVEAPVTLVVGPAGFGKTTTLGEWVSSSKRNIAWLTLDAADSNVHRFKTHLLAALQSAVPGFGEHRSELFGQGDQSPRAIGEAIAEEFYELRDDVVIVLDDFHEAGGPGILEVISAILQYPPPALHLVLSARWDPRLPIARLRGRGWLTEIRAADLRFTKEETKLLFTNAVDGLPDDSVVTLLYERTEGWAAGLRLASIALRGRVNARLIDDSLSGSGERHIMDFFLDEVLARQPPDVRTFLLLTSIPDQVCVPLADAIAHELSSGASKVMLEGLLHSNLYLELADAKGNWFRYHGLFRDLLRHRLNLELSADEIKNCHLRASQWFAANGMTDEAIAHAAVADPEESARLIERFRHAALERGEWRAIERWLDLLPNRVIHERPRLLLASGRVAFSRGQISSIRSIVREVDEAIERVAPSLDGVERCEIQAERDVLYALTLDPEDTADEIHRLAAGAFDSLAAADHCGRGFALHLAGMSLYATNGAVDAMRYLKAHLIEDVDRGVLAEILVTKALIQFDDGNVFEAERLAHYAMRVAPDRSMPYVLGWARLVLGRITYERNELETARAFFEAAASESEHQHFLLTRGSLLGLALTLEASGKTDEASAAASALLELVLEQGCFEHLPVVEALQARLALLRGDADTALETFGAQRVLAVINRRDARFVMATQTAALLAAGTREHSEQASEVLGRLQAEAGPGTSARDRIELAILAALLAESRPGNERPQLHAALQQAVEGGFTRTAADLGTLRLLRHLPPEQGSAWVSILLHACDSTTLRKQAPPPAAVLPIDRPALPIRHQHVLEVLTERESEVLDCFGEHLSNQEIADRLFISPLTVKRHACNIYNKLGVGGRRQALVKAIELGFIERR